MNHLDYEQQRLHLLHKHGIDLEDTNGIADGRKTKRMDRKNVGLLMGGAEGQGGVFTWREKNRRKVNLHLFSDSLMFNSSPSLHIQCLYRSFVSILDLLTLPQMWDQLVQYVSPPIRRL